MTGIEYQNKRIPCRLIIFDKDGTLVDFAATWVPLIEKRADFVLKALGKDGTLRDVLLRAWGINPLSGKIDPRGPCPVSPRTEEIVIGTVALYQQGYPWGESRQLVAQAFDEADATTDRTKLVKPVDGIQGFLHRLKREGFCLAIATSDERRDTEAILSALDLGDLFDILLCAEEASILKPDPEAIFSICRQLSIPPRETVFIGDTVTDMVMGKRAGVALTIGTIEGGVRSRDELGKVADAVVDSIRDLDFFSEP